MKDILRWTNFELCCCWRFISFIKPPVDIQRASPQALVRARWMDFVTSNSKIGQELMGGEATKPARVHHDCPTFEIGPYFFPYVW